MKPKCLYSFTCWYWYFFECCKKKSKKKGKQSVQSFVCIKIKKQKQKKHAVQTYHVGQVVSSSDVIKRKYSQSQPFYSKIKPNSQQISMHCLN